MRLRLPRLFCLLFATSLAAAASAAASAAAPERGPARRPAPDAAEDASQARVIVKYRADGSLMRALAARSPQTTAPPRPQHAAALSARLALPLADGWVLGPRTQALRGVGLSSSQLAARLAALDEVEWAVPDRRKRLLSVPNDPLFGPGLVGVTPTVGQWYLRAPDASAVSAVNAVGAWERTPGSASITVAVLDTGVRRDHPDLAGKLHAGYDFIADAASANDGNGRDADPSDPGDWTLADECARGEPAADSSWHGTQVSGLVGAATDNAQGMAGTGRNVMVLPVRVLGRCGGFDSDILAAMRWAAGLSADPVANPQPARVLNMSLGSTGACEPSYRDAVAELAAAGVSVVAAAGNETGLPVSTPANCPGVIAVAGVRHAGSKVGYSNIGPEVAIAAPAGNCVNLTGPCLYPLLSTVNSGTTAPAANVYSDSLNPTLGTSFAAPIVAGTIGLMLSLAPQLTPAQVRAALQATARPFPTTGPDPTVVACRAPTQVDQLECYCTTTTCGAGLLDASAAVAAVAPAQTAPTVGVTASANPVIAGASVVVSASNATAFQGRSIVGYQWSLAPGSAAASFSGATNTASATVVTAAAGSVTLMLTVTDSGGVTGSGQVTLNVTAPPVGGGSGGGGALGLGWLAGLALALWALRPGCRPTALCAGCRPTALRPGAGRRR